MGLPALTLQRASGDLGRVVTGVLDWSEHVRSKSLSRLEARRFTANGGARPGEIIRTAGGTVLLPPPGPENAGQLLVISPDSTTVLIAGTGTIGPTNVTDTITSCVVLISNGADRWARIGGRSDASTDVGVTVHADLTGLNADDHEHYLLCSGGRSAQYLHSNTYFATGTTPAKRGGLRGSNGHDGGYFQRNAANSTDVHMVGLTSANMAMFGDSTNVVSAVYRASVGHIWYDGTAQRMGLSARELGVRLDPVEEPAALAVNTSRVYFFSSGNVLCMGTYHGRSTVAPMRIA